MRFTCPSCSAVYEDPSEPYPFCSFCKEKGITALLEPPLEIAQAAARRCREADRLFELEEDELPPMSHRGEDGNALF